MNSLVEMKNNVLYDINSYNETKKKISKLLLKSPSDIELSQEYYLDWLSYCIKMNDTELFKIFINKYFFNEKNIQICKYLNKYITKRT